MTTPPCGWWQTDGEAPAPEDWLTGPAVTDLNQPLYMLAAPPRYLATNAGRVVLGAQPPAPDALPLIAYAPATPLKRLGDASFCADYGLDYPYVTGAMAHACASAAMVIEMGRHGMLGFFGSAGLPPQRVAAAIAQIAADLPGQPFGFNLIHSPNEPALEAAIVDLYLRHEVRLVSASAYLALTLPVVRYRVHGIHRNADGQIIAPNRIIATVSRVEVAAQFFAPPPERFLRELVAQGDLTEEQAALAEQIPMAQDLSAEADSGGHTDNRPSLALMPAICAVRDRMQAQYRYARPLRVGAAGGIATPLAAAAAFAMGAAFIVTGSVNQACVESGTSDAVRQMLAEAGQADVTMAPAADMFEMGVKVQVLKRGTMFPMRAAKLYELYAKYPTLDDLPPDERTALEQKIFRAPLSAVWQQTEAYFRDRDPSQIDRAAREPKHRMALVFRWYLGQASHWAIAGDPARKIDYQIWCGPAMGAFNEWVKGSFLEPPAARRIRTVALNILYGAGLLQRMNLLRAQGLPVPPKFSNPAPRPLAELEQYIR